MNGQSYRLSPTALDSSSEAALLLERMRQLERELARVQAAAAAQQEPPVRLTTRIQRWLSRRCGLQLGVLKQYGPRMLRLPRHYATTPLPPNPPAISIVTPSYNQADYLEETVRSVLDQNYPALEFIVQDGGSTDGTLDILKEYDLALTHWESAPDRGQASAINTGFRQTRGEIMAYLNSDDLLLPGALATVGRYFADHPDVDVVYGHRILIDDDGGEIGRWVLPPHDGRVLRYVDYIPQETLFWRRSLWERVGGLDESFQFALDWDLLLRFQDAGARFVRLPRYLGVFRVHDSQKSLIDRATTGKREMALLRKRYHGRHLPLPEIHHHIKGYLWQHLLLRWLHAVGLLRY